MHERMDPDNAKPDKPGLLRRYAKALNLELISQVRANRTASYE